MSDKERFVNSIPVDTSTEAIFHATNPSTFVRDYVSICMEREIQAVTNRLKHNPSCLESGGITPDKYKEIAKEVMDWIKTI